MTLAFIRHGKTLGNLEKRYVGKTDESLCQSGAAEIEKNVLQKKYPDAGIVFSSPMKRCLETCAIIYPKKKPVIIEDFCEMDFGSAEGKTYEELKTRPEYQKWLESSGAIALPSGETKDEFVRRTMRGFSKMLETLKKAKSRERVSKGFENLCVAAVVHGGTIMAAMSTLTKEDYYSFQIANGGVLYYKFPYDFAF